MLKFDHYGLLTPATGIDATKEMIHAELVAPFGTGTRREELYSGWLRYNADLQNLLQDALLEQWVNGSFVSQKIRPGDIDVVTLCDGKRLQELSSQLRRFRKHEAKAHYGVDGYFLEVYARDHRWASRTTSDKAYWRHTFGTLPKSRNRKSRSKGYLVIKL